MKHQRVTNTQFKFFLPAFCLCLGVACTEEKVIDEPDSDQLTEVSFSTSTLTRANGGTLASESKVRVYAYHNKTGVITTIVDPKDYQANADGNALEAVAPTVSGEGISSEATSMFLPSGSFNFYAVSTNSSTTEVPEFNVTAENGKPFPNGNNQLTSNGDKGVATGLQNGIDYLHAVKESQAISFGTSNESVPLSFKHATTQVQLTIKFSETACAASAEAASAFANATVYIQQTDVSNAYMRLLDGQIRFGNRTETDALSCTGSGSTPLQEHMLQMTVDKEANSSAKGSIPANQVATCCMMPLKSVINQTMWIQVVIDNLKVGSEIAPTTHTYTGKLNAANGWLAGKSNRYTLTLSGTEISFSTVEVQDWEIGSSNGEVGDLTDHTTTN